MLTETTCVSGRNLDARNFMKVDDCWIFGVLTKNTASANVKMFRSVSVYSIKKGIFLFIFGCKPFNVLNPVTFSYKMRNILLELALGSRCFDYLR